jgi:dienelactone hydrolase
MNNKGIDVGYIAHPSLLVPEDLANVKGPLSIAAAEIDEAFPPEFRHQAEKLLAETKQYWQINLYGGAWHGFASRGNLADPKIKFAREQAHQQAVSWFDAWL